MPKMLTQVWKTFFGSFFETEQEAAEAELHWKTDAAITEAWEACLKPLKDADAKALAEYNALPYTSRRDRYPPNPSASRFKMPEKFQAELRAALLKHKVLAPVTLSSSEAATAEAA